MAQEIFIRTGNKDYGPWDSEKLETAIRSGQIPFSAWIYEGEEWRLLAERADLRKLHPQFEPPPKTAPRKAAPAPLGLSPEPIWFVIREKKKFGPCSAVEILHQLQRKELSGSSFVWRPGYATWQRISSVVEFGAETMRRLLSEEGGMDILIRRKAPRAPYKVDVIAHDDKSVIEAQSMMIGEGGLFLAHDRPRHKLGARLKLHFRDAGLAAFNAIAEVVSVVRGPVAGYCLRFVALSEPDKKRISKFISERSPR